MHRLRLPTLRPATTPSPGWFWVDRTFRLHFQISQQTRCASHATQGVANGAKQGPGKRLGAKKGDSELVVPGNIIFRQRGSLWHPGENCVMGRDHTISSLVKGYVRYYRDPAISKARKYIGVVFEKDEVLPRQPGSPRRRRLNMEPRKLQAIQLAGKTIGVTAQIRQAVRYGVSGKPRTHRTSDTVIREGYQVRETNKSIGLTAEREGIVRAWRTDIGKERRIAWQKSEDQRRKAEGERIYKRQKARRYSSRR